MDTISVSIDGCSVEDSVHFSEFYHFTMHLTGSHHILKTCLVFMFYLQSYKKKFNIEIKNS